MACAGSATEEKGGFSCDKLNLTAINCERPKCPKILTTVDPDTSGAFSNDSLDEIEVGSNVTFECNKTSKLRSE